MPTDKTATQEDRAEYERLSGCAASRIGGMLVPDTSPLKIRRLDTGEVFPFHVEGKSESFLIGLAVHGSMKLKYLSGEVLVVRKVDGELVASPIF